MNWDPVRKLMDGRSRFVLVTHVNADGDGLGAQLALYHFLRRQGKDVRIVNTDPPPDNYAFVAPEGTVEIYDAGRHDALLASAEVIVLLDNSSAHRLGVLRGPIERSAAVKVCIDHHPRPDTAWDVMAIEETASATGEMVYDLIMEADGDLPPEAAEPIYVAIVTDTGNFRFSNTTEKILRIAADLVRRGVSVPRVYQQVYERNSPAFVRLMGAVLSELRLEREGRVGVLVVSKAMVQRCDAAGVDTSDIINHVLAIDGARVALLFREIDSTHTKVSFRSKGEIDVNRVAAAFGGGGHRNASGAVVAMTLAKAVEEVLAEVGRIV